jgi:hypothetical protein
MTATDDDPRRRIRQLILSGDNLRKTRHDPVAVGRARDRLTAALEIAQTQGLEDLAGIIELRLADLDPGGAS